MNIEYKKNIILNKMDVLLLYSDSDRITYTDDLDRLMDALEGSLCVISAWNNDELVGLIRVVGDDALILFIQDVIVKQKYQRFNISGMLMEMMTSRFKHVRQIVCLSNDEIGTLQDCERLGLRELNDGHGKCLVKYYNH